MSAAAAVFLVCLFLPAYGLASPPQDVKDVATAAPVSPKATASGRKPRLWPNNLVKYTKAKAVAAVRQDYRGYSNSGYAETANKLYRTWCSSTGTKAVCRINAGFDALPYGAAGSFCDEPRFPEISNDVYGCWQRWLWTRTITVTRIQRRKVWISYSDFDIAIFVIYNSPSGQIPAPLLEYYQGHPQPL